MDDLYAPPHGEWQRIQPALATVRRIAMIPWYAAVLIAAVTTYWLWGFWWIWLIAGVAVVGLTVRLVLLGRMVASYGWTEHVDDLWITHGAINRRLVVVPYGRMQLVDVTSGPLERRYGLATVVLHTAAALTQAEIPGLRPETAAQLRDRLTELGETRKSGL